MSKLSNAQYREAGRIFYEHSAGCAPGRAVIEELAENLQYTPIEPGAPLSEEEWGQICTNLGLSSSLWKRDKAKVDAVLARRTVRKADPKIDGDVLEAAILAVAQIVSRFEGVKDSVGLAKEIVAQLKQEARK